MFSSLQVGSNIHMNHKDMQVVDLNMSTEQIELKEVETGVKWIKSIDDIFDKHKNNLARFELSNQDLMESERILTMPLKGHSDKDTEEAYWKEGYVKASLDENGQWISNGKERIKLQKEHAVSIGEFVTCRSDRRIRSDYYRWASNGRVHTSLLSRKHKRGNKTPRLKGFVDRFVDKMINELYMDVTRPSVSAVHKVITECMEKEPRFVSVEPVSRSTVSRKIKNIDDYKREVAREGWFYAQKKYPHGSTVRKLKYLNLVWEMDNTPIDLIIIDEKTGEKLGRFWMTFVFCKITKMIQGYHISFHQPNAKSIIKAIKHAAYSKQDILDSDETLEGYTWPCRGLPAEIVMDNGSDYISHPVRNSCSKLGINVHFNRKKSAQRKGGVERVQGTANRQINDFMPGKSFSNYIQKGDYKSEDNAVITQSDLFRIINNWIVTIYHQTEHRTLKDKPINSWNKYREQLPALRMPPEVKDFDKLLWTFVNGSIQKNGIQKDYRYYRSVQLMDLAKRHGMKKKVDFYISEVDVSRIYVVIPDTEELLEVPDMGNEYAQLCLSALGHKEVLDHAENIFPNTKRGNHSDDQMIASYNDLIRIADEAEVSKRKRIREGVARRKQVQREKSNGATKQDSPVVLTGNLTGNTFVPNTEGL